MALLTKEKKKINWFPLTMAGIFLVFFAAATFFLFFKKPPVLEALRPTVNERERKISGIQLNPDRVVNSPVFQGLKDRTIFLEPAAVGRPNPFVPFSVNPPGFPVFPGGIPGGEVVGP